FAPLLLAGIWTAAAAALLGVAFNLANVIVLPLLFGLGVAGAIHLVARSRESDGVGEALRTSTPRAVLFSALTTIGSFGSIYLSSHPGTASMGLLLSLAITLTLISTLVFLPALLVVCGLGDKSEETQF
ncbi:MAG: MMPL family transporter, partial [Rhodospirillaceae bacterium]|nr:MMPL family transporter [Rhodospirillaceae bacterium]